MRFQKELDISKSKTKSTWPVNRVVNRKRGRSLMLGELGEVVQRFSVASRYKGGIVNISIALATAKSLTHRYSRLKMSRIDHKHSWTKRLL